MCLLSGIFPNSKYSYNVWITILPSFLGIRPRVNLIRFCLTREIILGEIYLWKHMRAVLKNCNVEIIIKDVSTVRYKPQRLWKWVEIVTELCR